MSVVALGSVRAAPGVTTAAIALAAAWPGAARAVLVEADPDGGVLAARFGLDPEPGLVSLAAACRRQGSEPVALDGHTQELPGGLPVVVAPAGADQAGAAAAGLAAGWPAPVGRSVVVDAGRLSPRSPALGVVAQADLLLVVCRPRADEAAALAPRVSSLEMVGPRVGLLVVGRHPHQPEDLAEAVGLDLVAVVEDDPIGAHLAGGGHGSVRLLHRSALMRSARVAAAAAQALAGTVPERVTP